MKKLLAAILALMLMMICLAGCGVNVENNRNNGMTKTNNVNVEFWTDEFTGVQYVIYDRSGGYAGMGGITPRLNSDGSLYIVN